MIGQAQADALEIEATAKRRRADEYGALRGISARRYLFPRLYARIAPTGVPGGKGGISAG
jgi:hypothetical protein